MGKIYTRKGDEGITQTLSKEKHFKDDIRFVVNGTIDECNSHIGVLLSYVREDRSELYLLERELTKIQRQLFAIGLEVTGNGKEYEEYLIKKSNVKFLEDRIDWFSTRCKTLKHFILPGGGYAASYAHVCRAYIRRVERELVTWQRMYDKEIPVILAYVNRLSDYFFAIGRYINETLNIPEVKWP